MVMINHIELANGSVPLPDLAVCGHQLKLLILLQKEMPQGFVIETQPARPNPVEIAKQRTRVLIQILKPGYPVPG